MEENQDLQLSIIVPVYNVEDYIRPCLESIFRQDLDERIFEVIIVNDGTEDRSMEKIQDIIEEHKNITVINQENQGLSVARNNGIAAAIGDYILMPDSDDFLIENSLRPLLEIAIESQADVVVADFYKMTNDEINSTKVNLPNFANIKIQEKTGEQMFFEHLYTGQYTVWRTLYKKEFLHLHQLKFIPGIYVQDKPFTHEVYLKAQKCIVTPWPFYIYRCHPKSVSYTMTEKYAKDYCIAINRMWDLSLIEGLPPKIKEKMRDYTYNAFYIMTWRLLHEIKYESKRANIIDYLNSVAPNLNFNHGTKQKITTIMLKKMPHTYIFLRYLHSIYWEDRIRPFLKNHSHLGNII